MSREETFDRDLADLAAIEHELRYLARRAAADLREEGMAARTITVKLRTNDWTTRTASRTLDAAVESDRAVVDTALALLADLRLKLTRPARLVGVALSNFTAGRDAEQLALAFGPVDTDARPVEDARDRDLSRALDRVRERFGDDAIHAGKEIGRAHV